MVVESRRPSGGTQRGRSTITEDDFRRLHPKLVAAFRRKGASPEIARELTQETLLAAHRGVAKFKGQSAFDTWVVSIGKQLWLKDCRDRGRLKRNAEETSLEAAALSGREPFERSHEDRVIARDQLARTRRLIRELPRAMREALTLHIEGHRYRAIAVVLKVSENQVASLIHQARRKLRREAGARPADVSP